MIVRRVCVLVFFSLLLDISNFLGDLLKGALVV